VSDAKLGKRFEGVLSVLTALNKVLKSGGRTAQSRWKTLDLQKKTLEDISQHVLTKADIGTPSAILDSCHVCTMLSHIMLYMLDAFTVVCRAAGMGVWVPYSCNLIACAAHRSI
jgi:hypothetical protein